MEFRESKRAPPPSPTTSEQYVMSMCRCSSGTMVRMKVEILQDGSSRESCPRCDSVAKFTPEALVLRTTTRYTHHSRTGSVSDHSLDPEADEPEDWYFQ